LAIVVFLLGLVLLLLGIWVYRSRWRLPSGLGAEMRLLMTVVVVLVTLIALYMIASTALRLNAAEGSLMVRRADDHHRVHDL
jgi:hypothetical protein